MASRKSPSQRDPGAATYRNSKILQAGFPGVNGRVVNSYPIDQSIDFAESSVDSNGDTSDDTSVSYTFRKDRFPSSGTFSTAQSTITLSSVPIAGSLHLYRNRNTILDEATDYVVNGRIVTFSSGVASSGDFYVAQYVQQNISSSFTDTFNRANSAITGYVTNGPNSTTTPDVVSNAAVGHVQGVNDATSLFLPMLSSVQSNSTVYRSSNTPYTNGRKYLDVWLRSQDSANGINVEFRIDTGLGNATDLAIYNCINGVYTQLVTTSPGGGPVFTFPITINTSVDANNVVTASAVSGFTRLDVSATTSITNIGNAGPIISIDQEIEESTWNPTNGPS